MIAPKTEEPVIDPKAKQAKDAPKITSKFTEQEESQYGPNKIYYEFKRAVEASETTQEVEGIEPEI